MQGMPKPPTHSPARAIALLLATGVLIPAMGWDLPPHARPGPDPDHPPFVSEPNGVFQMPWGGGGYRWPEQLFWEDMSQVNNKHLEMLQSSDAVEAQGKVPMMSSVAWGYEYQAAIGGDSANGLADMRREEGWRAYGTWLSARKEKYFAQDWEGKIFYPYAGYVTPMMPLDKEDWPAGIENATFGDFAGEKLGKLANRIRLRGMFAADFVVGLYGGNHDFHPRVIDDFERWAGVDVPGTTVKERADVIKARHWSRYNDFKCDRMARFYTRMAETIRSSGREPMVGGQILPHAASVRGTGNDFRIYARMLPPKNWFFQVETQSDAGRPVPQYWVASSGMGGHAARAPMMALGAHMDAYAQAFWDAVKGGGHDETWARRYMKHAWLSVGWTHVANLDGSVRRAPQAFQRGYWDIGGIDTPIVALVRQHVPRHPFGPAFYYSTDLERQSEGTGNPNFYFWFEPKLGAWRPKGIPSGYFVSDTALAGLARDTANWPSGWFVYVDNLGYTRLADSERKRLEAIAPILTEEDYRDSCPLSFTGDSLGGFAFIDQKGSVIVLVSNASSRKVAGSLEFARVVDSVYQIRELLGTVDTRLRVAGGKASFRLSLEGRETRVFEIPGLRERGKQHRILPGRPLPPLPSTSAIRRPEGARVDALGRRSLTGPGWIWNAQEP